MTSEDLSAIVYALGRAIESEGSPQVKKQLEGVEDRATEELSRAIKRENVEFNGRFIPVKQLENISQRLKARDIS